MTKLIFLILVISIGVVLCDYEYECSESCRRYISRKSPFPRLPNDPIYQSLFQEAKQIDCSQFTTQLDQTVLKTNADALVAARDNIDRVTVILADGKVVADSTIEDVSSIENHNTRIAVLTSQLSQRGIGWEQKTSSTTGNKEYYISKRCDVSGAGFHTGAISVRISRVVAA